MAGLVLNQSVLVLNRSWLAVNFCSVRRALVLLYQGLAQVVTKDYETYDFDSWRELSQFAHNLSDDEPDRLIRTPCFVLKAPEVILLTRYNRCPPYYVKFNRRNIFLRDNYTCQYCGVRSPKDELTIDHIVPRSRGGKSCWENVALACNTCNTKKGDGLPGECGLRLLRQPRKPHWLTCVQHNLSGPSRLTWQKFIDAAYWESTLHE